MSSSDWLNVYVILTVAAAACFLIAAVTALNPSRFWTRLVPLGLFLWVTVSAIGYIRQVR